MDLREEMDVARVYPQLREAAAMLPTLEDTLTDIALKSRDCPCGESDVQPVVDKTFLLGNVSGYSPCTG